MNNLNGAILSTLYFQQVVWYRNTEKTNVYILCAYP